MHTELPAPYGEVTRRWTHLDPNERDHHAHRLVGTDHAHAHIEQPGHDSGRHYRLLVDATLAGDPTACAWLATSHAPLCIARGRALLAADPQEWGGVCLELLHTTLHTVDLDGRWLRQRVADTLRKKLGRAVTHHLARTRLEQPIELYPDRPQPAYPGGDPYTLVELSCDLAPLLADLDTATVEALHAIADHRWRADLAGIAARHHLSHAALRTRLTRARARLAPQLAAYRPAA